MIKISIRVMATAGLVASGVWLFKFPAEWEARTAFFSSSITLLSTFIEVSSERGRLRRPSVRRILSLARGLTPVTAVVIPLIVFAGMSGRLDVAVLDSENVKQIVDRLLFYLFALACVGLVLSRWPQREVAPTPTTLLFTGGVSILSSPASKEKTNTLKLVGRPEVIGTPYEIRQFRRLRLKDEENKIDANRAFPILVWQVQNFGSEPVRLQRLRLKVLRVRKGRDGTQSAYVLDSAQNALLDCSIFLDPESEYQEAELEVAQDLGPQEACRLVLILGQKSGTLKLDPVEYEATVSVLSDSGELALDSHRVTIDYPFDNVPNGTGRVRVLRTGTSPYSLT